VFAVITCVVLVNGQSRQSKLQNCVSDLNAGKYDDLPGFDGKDITSVGNLLKFGFESMDATFDHTTDDMPSGRPKYIHPLGSVGPVKFVPNANGRKFTGMFKGADSCVARLSLAGNPEKIGFTPGMGIKCYPDGTHASANFISMFSLDGQKDNYNFFANEFTNIIQEPTSLSLKAVEKTVFNRASSCATWLSLKQFSSVDQNGNVPSPALWPQQLWLVPGNAHFPEDKGRDFRDDLEAIPVGTTIWTVEASNKHNVIQRFEIGSIVTTGPFVASKFGDESLFFEHDRGEEDNCGNDDSLSMEMH